MVDALVTVIPVEITSPYFTTDEAIKYLRMDAKMAMENARRVYLRYIRTGKLKVGGRPGEPLATRQQLDAFVAVHKGGR